MPTDRRGTAAGRCTSVVGEARAAADRARAARAPPPRLRLAELREGVWLRPDNLRPAVLPDAEAVVADQCRTLRAPSPTASPADLAADLWDLDGWADRAHALRRRLGAVVGALDAGDLAALAGASSSPPPCCATSRPTRSCPPSCCPAAGPATTLRADYDRYDPAYKAVWTAWYREQRAAIGNGARTARP